MADLAQLDTRDVPVSLIPLDTTGERPAVSSLANARELLDAAEFHESAQGRRDSGTARRDSTYRRLLGVADLLAGATAIIATGILFGGVSLSLFAALVVIVPVAKMGGLYDRDEYVLNKTTLDEVPKLLTLALVFVIGAYAARDALITNEDLIGAGQLVTLVALTLMLLAGCRVAARRIARAVTTPERCLLVGEDGGCDRFAELIVGAQTLNTQVVGRVRLSSDEMITDPGLLRHVSCLRDVVSEHAVERIVVVPHDRTSDEVPEIIRAIKSIGVKVSVAPRMLDAVGSAMEIEDIGGMQLMGVRDLKMTTSSILLKRAMDLAVAGLGLLVLAPWFAIVALAIKIDSRGPVFYRQKRVGRDGRQFAIFKFRSMRVGAHDERSELMHMNETSGLFKISDDPRVTRVGRLLRATSFDELPQLINVVLGDMSLVGPRPLVPEEDENITGWYRRRSHIMPGITGVWQLLGPVRIPLDEMVKLDYLYVTHWSIWSDIKLLLRTVPHVLSRRGV